MSKIYGFVFKHDCLKKEDTESVMGKMEEALLRRSFQKSHHVIRYHAGLGHISVSEADKIQVLCHAEKSLEMVYNGYFLLAGGYKDKPVTHHSDRQTASALLFLEQFAENGDDFARNLNGVFTMAILDESAHELVLINDRMGAGLLYYSIFEQGIVFASEVKGVVACEQVRRRINWKAWSDFFNIGWITRNDTFFEDVYTLPPASLLRYNYQTGIHSITRYWSAHEIEVDNKMTEAQAAERCIDAMVNTVNLLRDLRGKILLPLSGGNDSRFIFMSLIQAGIDFQIYTTIKDNAETSDWVISQQLAQAFGINRISIDLEKDLYLRHFLTLLEDTDFMVMEHLWLYPMIEQIGHDAAVFDGYAGGTILGLNVLLDDLEELENPSAVSIKERLYSGFRNVYMEEPYDLIFKPEIFAMLKDAGLKSFLYEEPKISKHFQMITKLHNRAHRGIGLYSFTMLNDFVLPVLPFLENGYFETVLSVPFHFRYKYYLYNIIIQKMMPEIRDILTTRMDIDKSAYPRRRRIVDHPETIGYLFRLLKENPLPVEIVNTDYQGQWIERLLQGKKNPVLRVRPFLYFSLWYNRYIR